jgi:ribose 5-phosphate isomerase A
LDPSNQSKERDTATIATIDDIDDLRRSAGEAAAALVPDGATLGYGTGRAAAAALAALAVRVSSGLRVRGVPTSLQTQALCERLGLALTSLDDLAPGSRLDLALDGADEVDPNGDALKGGGGALTREKQVALAARELVLVFEENKRVPRLGATRALPIEILAFGYRQTLARIEALLPGVQLRGNANGAPALSDNGGLLCDAPLPPGADLALVAKNLKLVAGVVEHGLFLGLHPTLVFAGPSGVQVVRR